MHSITGPAVGLHEDNESFPFQNDILRYVYCTWQWQGDTTVCYLWPFNPGLPCGFLSTVGEIWCYVAAGEYERTTFFWQIDDILQRQSYGSGCIWTPYQFRMLSTVDECLVNPGNEQQLEQRHLYRLFLSSPSSNRSSWGLRVSASSCEHGWSPTVFWPSLELTTPSNRVNMMTCLPCTRKHTIVLGTGRVHAYCHHFVRSLFF